MRLSWIWPTFNLLATLITSVCVFVVPGTPFQPYVVMGFLCFCPGMALVRFLRLNDLAVELSLAVALSLSAASITAGAFLYAKHWSPPDTLTILVLLTLTCSIAQLVMQLPIVGIATSEEQSDDVSTSETISMTALKKAADGQSEIIKENTPQPLEVASSQGRKAAWGLEEAATIVTPTVAADQQPLQSIEQATTTIMPVASESSKKDIEQAATTIMPVTPQPQTKHSTESMADRKTTLLAAASSAPDIQKVEEKDTSRLPSADPQSIEEKNTTLLPSADPERIEEKNTTLLPSANPQRVEEQNTILTASPIEAQDTQELHQEEIRSLSPVTEPPQTPKVEKKQAATTSSVPKPPETPAIIEKKTNGTAAVPEPQQAQEDEEKEHTDKRPVVRPRTGQRDRDTDATIDSNNLASPGETPHPIPALSSPAGGKPVLRKRRLLNQ